MEKEEKNRWLSSVAVPLLFVSLMWLVELCEKEFRLDFTSWGILPRTVSGLRGILAGPFIHGDWNHLINNSIPLLILGTALFYFYREVALRVGFLSFLLAGLYTWISARSAYHIGASGLVYALFGFLLISGFLRRYIPLIALSFLVAFLYGSLIWGVLPWKKEVSWEGHFWGLFIGIVLAIFYRKKGPQRKVYHWEEEDDSEEEAYWLQEEKRPNSYKQEEVVYHFVPKKNEKKN
jgi:membrane associated rhomboid family serine protease